MTIRRRLFLAGILAATSGCDLVAGPATAEEKQLLRAAMVHVAEQARRIDISACLDRTTRANRDHLVFPNSWEPAQFSLPAWRAYGRARLPTHPVRLPGSGAPEGVYVRSGLLNDLFCRGWRVKLHTPLFSGRYGYVVAEDPVAFFIFAFVRENGGWRLVHSGTRVEGSIVI